MPNDLVDSIRAQRRDNVAPLSTRLRPEELERLRAAAIALGSNIAILGRVAVVRMLPEFEEAARRAKGDDAGAEAQ